MTRGAGDTLRQLLRPAWMAVLDAPCPAHEDATSGVPCWCIRVDDGHRIRTALCRARVESVDLAGDLQ